MSQCNPPYKILLKISGSIAAYKAAMLCSQLTQRGYDVKVVCSQNALKFIGATTFEGLTGHAVSSDTFERGKAMDHIHLMRWADLTLLYPATANTLNKLSHGFGDDLLSTLFLAHDFSKPYLIAPAMNDKMFHHPTTQASLKKINDMGLHIFPIQKGRLACGEQGDGRIIEPEKVISFIENYFSSSKQPQTAQPQNILISSGGTRENIDGVRFISNMSSGKTGSSIADSLLQQGHSVTFLHAKDSQKPSLPCYFQEFSSSADLKKEILHLLGSTPFDIFIHLAAVSDYSAESIEIDGQLFPTNSSTKISSQAENITVHLKKNPKLIDKIKSNSLNSSIKVVGFKLTKTTDPIEKKCKVSDLFSHSSCDLVVHNDLFDIQRQEHTFTIFNHELKNIHSCKNSSELGPQIIKHLNPRSFDSSSSHSTNHTTHEMPL